MSEVLSLSPNFNNKSAIVKAQKQYDKEVNRRKPDSLKIAMTKTVLDREMLFEESYALKHNGEIWFLFSHASQVVKILDTVVPYGEIASYQICESYAEQSYTTTRTKTKGGVTRAVVGGALFGGVGAIVGAATAGSRGTSNTTHYKTRNGFLFYVFGKDGTCLAGVHSSVGSGFLGNKPPKPFVEAAFIFDGIIKQSQLT